MARKPLYFCLPPTAIEFYDDPYAGTGMGDDGWSVEKLVADVRKHGLYYPVCVGFSRHKAKEGSAAVYAINGNHRLEACKKLKLAYVFCCNSECCEDARDLTAQQILDLGGRLLGPQGRVDYEVAMTVARDELKLLNRKARTHSPALSYKPSCA